MRRALALLAQVALYAAFAAFVGYFSARPQYLPLPPGHALLKLSMSHAGAVVSDCRQRSSEELEKLPPNMRLPTDCPRERSPLTIELSLDGRVLHAEIAAPAGLSRDGAATLYRRFVVPAGAHRIGVRLNDNVRTRDATAAGTRDIVLVPGQVLVIDFDAERRQILFL